MTSLRSRLTVLFGLWTVGTFAPPLWYFVAGPFGGSVGLTEGTVVAGLFVLAASGAAVGLPTDGVANQFRSGLELGVPMLCAAATLLGAVPASILWGIVPAIPFALGGTVGFSAAFLVGYLADQTVIKRSRITTDSRLVWHARKRPEAGWFQAMRFAGIGASFAVAAVLWEAGGGVLAGFWGFVGVLQIALLVLTRRRRRYELTDAGLITAFGHLPWAEFEGYELTDDTLVLYGTRWPFTTIAYDSQSIDNLEAVRETIAQQLPEKTGWINQRSVVDQFRRLLSS